MALAIIEQSIHDFHTVESMEETLRKHAEEQGTPRAAWELQNYDAETSIAHVNDPAVEAERLRVLVNYKNIFNYVQSNAELDELTKAASEICGTHFAALNIIDLGRQWTKSIHGLAQDSDVRELSRKVSFCAHTIRRKAECGVLVVPDTLDDERFCENSLVWDMGIRFYAGAPVRSPEGAVLGALCVFDTQPHPEGLSASQQKQLLDLADCAMAALVMES